MSEIKLNVYVEDEEEFIVLGMFEIISMIGGNE